MGSLYLIAVLIYSGQCYGDMLAGPYTIIPEHAESCPEGMLDMPFPINWKLTRDRHNQHLWSVWANFTWHVPLEDAMEARLIFASWSSRGGWKENALSMKFKRPCLNCKQYLPGVWNAVMAVLESESGIKDCPFPAESYTVNNVSSASLIPPKAVPIFFYGKWRVDVQVHDVKASKICACIRVFAQTVPRTNLK